MALKILEALPEAVRPAILRANDNTTAVSMLTRGPAIAVIDNALVLQTEPARLGSQGPFTK